MSDQFDKYYHAVRVSDSSSITEHAVVVAQPLSRQGSYGHSWMRDAIKSRLANNAASQRPRQELEDYLTAPLEDVDNVVAWWGVCSSLTLWFLAH